MAPAFTEDEIDDLLYFARTGDKEEFDTLSKELCRREKIGVVELLEVAKDEDSGNGILHMAAANGHQGKPHLNCRRRNTLGHYCSCACADSIPRTHSRTL